MLNLIDKKHVSYSVSRDIKRLSKHPFFSFRSVCVSIHILIKTASITKVLSSMNFTNGSLTAADWFPSVGNKSKCEILISICVPSTFPEPKWLNATLQISSPSATDNVVWLTSATTRLLFWRFPEFFNCELVSKCSAKRECKLLRLCTSNSSFVREEVCK